MSFDERVGLVLLSSAISVFVSVVSYLIFKYSEKIEQKKAVYYGLGLLAKNLSPAIANNDSNGIKPTIEFLLSKFHIFCSDNELNSSFKLLYSNYVFLCNGGYKSDANRAELDIIEIDKIAEIYQVGTFCKYPVLYKIVQKKWRYIFNIRNSLTKSSS